MHLSVTILILQVFKRSNKLFLAAAMGVELLVNGLVAGLSEAGLGYVWVILVAVVLMAGNLYLLREMRAFDLEDEPEPEIVEAMIERLILKKIPRKAQSLPGVVVSISSTSK